MNTTAPRTIAVLATWQIQPDQTTQVFEQLAQLRRRSLDEPGCLTYDVLRSDDDPYRVVLVESYRNAAALESHRQSPHFVDLVLGQIVPRLASRSVELLRYVPG